MLDVDAVLILLSKSLNYREVPCDSCHNFWGLHLSADSLVSSFISIMVYFNQRPGWGSLHWISGCLCPVRLTLAFLHAHCRTGLYYPQIDGNSHRGSGVLLTASVTSNRLDPFVQLFTREKPDYLLKGDTRYFYFDLKANGSDSYNAHASQVI